MLLVGDQRKLLEYVEVLKLQRQEPWMKHWMKVYMLQG